MERKTMTKEELTEKFRILHREIAEKVDLTPSQIQMIRTMTLSESKTVEQIKEFCFKKIQTKGLPTSRKRAKMREEGTWVGYRVYRDKPKKYYQGILDFLDKKSEEDMAAVLVVVPRWSE